MTNSKRKWIVTGASGGIGRSVAGLLADENSCLFLQGCQRKKELEETAAELRSKGAEVHLFTADFASADDRSRFCQDVLEAADGDLANGSFIGAAGLDLMSSASKMLTFDGKLEKIFAVDITANVQLARFFGRKFYEANSAEFSRTAISTDSVLSANTPDAGITAKKANLSNENYLKIFSQSSIVLFGWDGAARGMEGETAQLYSLAKGAIIAFVKSLAQDLAPRVRVCSVSPGWIQTTWGSAPSEKFKKRGERESLAGRWGTPEEIARAVRFLVSKEASFVNGQDLTVNGGFNCRDLS